MARGFSGRRRRFGDAPEPGWVKVFRLSFSGGRAGRLRALWLAIVLTAAVAGPEFASTGDEPALREPARAQAVWTAAWAGVLFWLCPGAARAADRLRRGGVAEMLFSGGTGRAAQLCGMTTAHLTGLCGALIIPAAAVCALWARPADPEEARSWVLLNLQFALLMIPAAAALICAAAGLGARFGQAWGASGSLLAGLAGLYCMEAVEALASPGAPAPARLLWALLPHLHLADLTNRLVFKLGALPAEPFLGALGYLWGLAFAAAASGLLLFTPRRTAL